MICKNCGKTIPDDVIYCPSCGKKIETHLRAEDSEYVYKEPEDEEEKKPSRGKSCLKALISIILALIFVVLAFFVVLKVAKKYLGEEPWDESDEQAVQTEESAPAKTMYVSAEDGLLLRSGPGEDNDAIHILIKGQEVQESKTENDWACINADGIDGWCPAESLSEEKIEVERKERSPKSQGDRGQLVEPTPFINNGCHFTVNTEGGLNLRCGPGQDYDIILVVPDKAEVVEQGREGDWIYIRHDGEQGWIKLEYVLPKQAE